ncbi:38098_t:CDS:1, partial [Gigaspora margarita]
VQPNHPNHNLDYKKNLLLRYWHKGPKTLYQYQHDMSYMIIESKKRDQEKQELLAFCSQVVHAVLDKVNSLEVSDECILQALLEEKVEELQFINYCQHCSASLSKLANLFNSL